MATETKKLGDLQQGSYIIYNGEPCMITKKSSPSSRKSSNGKEKVYLEGLFDGQKRTFVEDPDTEMEVPLIERGKAQILAIMGDSAQLMDLSTYEAFQLDIPLRFRGEIEEGEEVEYVQAMGRKKIERLKG